MDDGMGHPLLILWIIYVSQAASGAAEDDVPNNGSWAWLDLMDRLLVGRPVAPNLTVPQQQEELSSQRKWSVSPTHPCFKPMSLVTSNG
jgi:hypothetical protein